MDYKLLSVSIDPKTKKGEKFGFITGILYLSPARLSGHNVCPDSTAGCRSVCLNTAGLGGIFNTIQEARKRKTNLFYEHREVFFNLLQKDIDKLRSQANQRKLTPCVRLNGTSDLAYEKIAPYLFENNRVIRFYDYTKSERRYQDFLDKRLPRNYHLTLSSHERMEIETIDEYLAHNGTVTVVFSTKKSKELPKRYKGHRVFNGDTSDLRFLDPKGYIIGLKAKGKARKDTSGFVVSVNI